MYETQTLIRVFTHNVDEPPPFFSLFLSLIFSLLLLSSSTFHILHFLCALFSDSRVYSTKQTIIGVTTIVIGKRANTREFITKVVPLLSTAYDLIDLLRQS
jgi:hypothetical protein